MRKKYRPLILKLSNNLMIRKVNQLISWTIKVIVRLSQLARVNVLTYHRPSNRF